MSIFKKTLKDASEQAGAFLGAEASKKAQEATNQSIEGMNYFRNVAEAKKNVAFEQAKGNLFEYIEAAKFNKNAASAGSKLHAVVTDSVGRPHDAADIEITRNGSIVRQVQAKFSDSQKAAADSVTMHRKDKYAGMQRLIRKEENYTDTRTGEKTSLLKRAKGLAEERANKEGTLYQKQYRDVADNLTDELNHGGVSSGGTTVEEVRRAYDNPDNYAKSFERKQVAAEMKTTATNAAAASMVTSGVVSGVTNMFSVFSNEKTLAQAFEDVSRDVAKSGIRGGAVGGLSTVIRYEGIKKGSALLSDSMSATVMAGGVIDGGVALYEYARGEITPEQLRDALVDTTAKAATTIYYTKAVTAIMGASVNPFVPMAVYTTAGYVIRCTREILREAKLATEEANRLTAILQESTRVLNASHEEFARYVAQCEKAQREMLEGFVENFEYNIETGENYEQAIQDIVQFANLAGISLQHASFDDFSSAMKSKQTFILG